VSDELIKPLDERYRQYLHDESGLCGAGETISFPRSEAEIAAVVASLSRAGTPLTVQGSRSGLVGAAVPLRGHVLNLTQMTRIERPHCGDDGVGSIVVEPGVTLLELRRTLAAARLERPLFWPPDPTEATATVGGVVAMGARGLSALRYGPARMHVRGLRLVDADGEVQEVSAGDRRPGCELELLDVICSGEGMSGAVSELTLRLTPKPAVIWGVCLFFTERASLCAFVDGLARTARAHEAGAPAAGLAVLEYLDRRAIDLAQTRQASSADRRCLPPAPPGTLAAVVLELHGDDEEEVAGLAGGLLQLLDESGGDPDTAWALIGEAEAERLREFRHAAAAGANQQGELARAADPSRVRLALDASLPGMPFSEALELYESGLRAEGLDGCLFGHVRDNRLVATVLPRTNEEHRRGRRLIAEWAGRAVAVGGRPVNEHGVGKLHRELLAGVVHQPPWPARRACAAALDPAGRWNPGNMF
jgi:D-lactate dehydrogenase (cytochrome)